MHFSLNVKPAYAELQGLFLTLLESYMRYLLCRSYLLNTPFFKKCYAFSSDSICLETSFTLYILPSVEWV